MSAHGQELGGGAGIIGLVREESHLDEMREAIRGDFRRLERRRGGQVLMQAQPERRTAEAAESPPDSGPEPRSWLARLLSR